MGEHISYCNFKHQQGWLSALLTTKSSSSTGSGLAAPSTELHGPHSPVRDPGTSRSPSTLIQHHKIKVKTVCLIKPKTTLTSKIQFTLIWLPVVLII